MSLILTIIFAVLGFRFFGGQGALLGFFSGMVGDLLISTWLRKRKAMRVIKAEQQKQAQQVFLATLSSLCAHVAGVDGSFSPEEYAAFRRVLRDLLKLKKKDWKRADKIFRDALFTTHSIQMLSAQYFELFRDQRPILLNTIDLFFQLAVADGKLVPAEEKLIRDIAHMFAISRDDYSQIIARYGWAPADQNTSKKVQMSSVDSAYAVLGAKVTDSFDEITRKYRKLLSEYHPDKIHSKDLPAGFMEFANSKVIEIRSAYELISAQKGKPAR